MPQIELDRLVARATGEDLRTIIQHGFSVADPTVVAYDPSRPRQAPSIGTAWMPGGRRSSPSPEAGSRGGVVRHSCCFSNHQEARA